jgi:hypothetical protein
MFIDLKVARCWDPGNEAAGLRLSGLVDYKRQPERKPRDQLESRR